MKLEDQCCTLAQAKRLKELGIFQSNTFHYAASNEYSKLYYGPPAPYLESVSYSAYTVAELGVMLPPGFDTMFCINEGWRGYDADGNVFKDTPYATEAELRADMIIELLEKFPDAEAYRTQISWRLQK